MTNQKNKFFTLIFSCCPGAGEMYFGHYKMGVSLMGAFFGGAAVAAWLGWNELLLLICPVVWCYSFFHTHNLRGMTEEAFLELEDRFFFADYVKTDMDWMVTEKHRRLFGILLLLMGFSFIWRTGLRLLGSVVELPRVFWEAGYAVPQLLLAAIVLYGAVKLMKIPKENTEEMEETAF